MRPCGSGAQGSPLWDAVEPRLREGASVGHSSPGCRGPPTTPLLGFPGPCHGLAPRSVRAASPCPAVLGSCRLRLGSVSGSLRAQGSASAIGAGSTVVTDHSPDGPLRETTIWSESSSHPHLDTRPAGRSGQAGPGGGWEEGPGCGEGAVKTQREGGEQRPKGNEPAQEVDGQAGAPKEWLPGHVALLGQA